jgi:hypothetical protein
MNIQEQRHPVMQRHLIGITDYMRLFNVPRSTAQDRINKLPPGVVIKVGRLTRVDADALNAWIAAGGDLADKSEG